MLATLNLKVCSAYNQFKSNHLYIFTAFFNFKTKLNLKSDHQNGVTPSKDHFALSRTFDVMVMTNKVI